MLEWHNAYQCTVQSFNWKLRTWKVESRVYQVLMQGHILLSLMRISIKRWGVNQGQ